MRRKKKGKNKKYCNKHQIIHVMLCNKITLYIYIYKPNITLYSYILFL